MPNDADPQRILAIFGALPFFTFGEDTTMFATVALDVVLILVLISTLFVTSRSANDGSYTLTVTFQTGHRAHFSTRRTWSRGLRATKADAFEQAALAMP